MLPIEPNRWWLFWGIVVTLFGILIFNLFGFPLSLIGRETPAAAEAKTEVNVYLTDDERAIMVDPEKAIEFTKKAVCRQHAQMINTMVELWYVQHDGRWPLPDLSDIGRDRDYFPNGVPICPYNGMPYTLDPLTFRVEGHFYGETEEQMQEIFEAGKESRQRKQAGDR